MTSWYRDFSAGPNFGGTTAVAPSHEKIPASRRPKHRFDFDIGYLVKSPCRNCLNREAFPGCDEACETLDKLHALLCDSVSCTKRG